MFLMCLNLYVRSLITLMALTRISSIRGGFERIQRRYELLGRDIYANLTSRTYNLT